MMCRPWRSKARARTSTSKAVSVPSRDIRLARRSSVWVVVIGKPDDYTLAASMLRNVAVSPLWFPGSPLLQPGSRAEEDNQAGTDQGQHDAMVEIVAGRARTSPHRECGNSQQHATQGDEIGD